jgi:hypothetical protein
LNPGSRGGKPATNRFSYGAANHAVAFLLILKESCKINLPLRILLSSFEKFTPAPSLKTESLGQTVGFCSMTFGQGRSTSIHHTCMVWSYTTFNVTKTNNLELFAF